MQDVAGIDRHQRRCPAQQDGEQIKRYRPQYCRIVAHETKAGEHGGTRGRLFGGHGPVQLDRPVQHPRQKPEDGHHCVRHAGRHRVSQTAQCRTD